VILATRWEADAELEALRTLAARVRDLVLGSADMPSSLATSMSTAAANRVCSGSCSALVAVGLHFQELRTELQVLESRHSMDLTEDEADALWT
jgi:hypothetical protein